MLVQTPSALAHGDGESYEETKGNYLIDIGYEKNIMAQQPASFDFNILNAQTQEEIPFTSVWVQVIKDDKTLFATGLYKQDIGATTLLYTFPMEGTYEISARFQNDDTTLAESKFPVTITGNSASAIQQTPPPNEGGLTGLTPLIATGIMGVTVGAIITKLYAVKSNRKTKAS